MSNEKDEKDIPENVRVMADNLKGNHKYENSTITYNEKAFKDSLPPDIKYKFAKAYEKHKMDFSAAVHLASGEIGNEQFAKDPELNQVKTMPVNMVHCKLDIVQTRCQKGVMKTDGTERPWEIYGKLDSNYVTNIDRKTGKVGVVKEYVSREAKSMFGNDD